MEQNLTNENNQMIEIRKKEARPFYTPKDSTSMFLWVLLGSFVLSFVLSLVYLSISSGMELKIEKFLNLKPVIFINAFVMQLFFIIIYFIFIAKNKISFIKANNLNKPLSWQQIAIILVLVGCLYVFTTPFCASFEAFLEYCGYPLSDIGIKLDNVLSITLCIIFLGIVPAFIEEFIFRGAVLQGFKKYGKWVAILVSALLFTLMHGNVQQTIYQFGCGVLFGLLVWETGSIWASIILHAGNNILVIVLQTLVDCGVINAQSADVTWIYIIFAFILVIALIGIILLALKLIKKYKPIQVNSDKLNFSLYYEPEDLEDYQNDDFKNSIHNKPLKFKSGCKALANDKEVFSNLLWGISIALLIILINLA